MVAGLPEEHPADIREQHGFGFVLRVRVRVTGSGSCYGFGFVFGLGPCAGKDDKG